MLNIYPQFKILKTYKTEAGDYGSVVDLLSKHGALVSIPSTTNKGSMQQILAIMGSVAQW